MPVVRAGSWAGTLASVSLTLLLLAGGPLLDRAWAKGSHGTPEHWAYHVLMMSLGLVDHHTTHAFDEAGLASTGVSHASDGVSLAAPEPSAVTSTYGVTILSLILAAFVVGFGRPFRFAALERAIPRGTSLEPVERPPRGR